MVNIKITIGISHIFCHVDAEKDYTCLKGLLVVNWIQIHNRSLAAIVPRGLSHILISEKICRLSCQASVTEFLLSELNLIKEALESYFDQWADTCPIQSNYILICFFTEQSEWLCTDQSRYSVLTYQDISIWANQTVQILICDLHKKGPIRN